MFKWYLFNKLSLFLNDVVKGKKKEKTRRQQNPNSLQAAWYLSSQGVFGEISARWKSVSVRTEVAGQVWASVLE